MESDFEQKKLKTKQTMARIALVLMVLGIIAACLCMAFGTKELMMAALFCIIIVPIIIYCFIMVYDRVHRDEKENISVQELIKESEKTDQAEEDYNESR